MNSKLPVKYWQLTHSFLSGFLSSWTKEAWKITKLHQSKISREHSVSSAILFASVSNGWLPTSALRAKAQFEPRDLRLAHCRWPPPLPPSCPEQEGVGGLRAQANHLLVSWHRGLWALGSHFMATTSVVHSFFLEVEDSGVLNFYFQYRFCSDNCQNIRLCFC